MSSFIYSLIHSVKHFVELLLCDTHHAKYQVLGWPDGANKTASHQTECEFQINHKQYLV